MNEQDKKELMEEFKNSEGGKRLELWDYACQQQLIWEQIMQEMQNIARQQGVDKKIDELVERELKKAEPEG
jgi:hypothetical protein